MTWEELAKFIMEMPEDEAHRPAWVRLRNGVTEVHLYNLGRASPVSMKYERPKIKKLKKNDWVIE